MVARLPASVPGGSLVPAAFQAGEIQDSEAPREGTARALGLRGNLAGSIASCHVQEGVAQVQVPARIAAQAELHEAGRGALQLDVEDNGRGFDPTQPYAGHLGLRSMRERAAKLGGEISLDSAPGDGARIRVSIPLNGSNS